MRSVKGSVTVFLSLTGLLIFALIGTLLETARYNVCKNHAARTLRTSAEGLLTEYSRPLYEHYGLFFIESSGTPYEQVIGNYAGDTLSAADKGDMDFFQGAITGIQVKDKIYLGDEGAEPLQKQIQSYMGRVLTKEQLTKFLSDSKKLAQVEQSAKEIEETVQQEEKAAELDKELLSLMQLIDGISVSGGVVTCQSEFVKMFATGEMKGQNFGITEGTVWKKMKPKLDDSVRTWDIPDKTTFLDRLARVKEKTQQAIKKGEKISKQLGKRGKSSSDEHDKMFEDFVANLPVLNRNEEILTQTEEMLRTGAVKDNRKELEKLWKDYNTSSLSFDYTGVTETGGGDNPKDSLSDAWRKGILNIVCKSPSQLSKKAISKPDSYAEYYKEQETFDDYGDRVSDFAASDDVSLTGIAGDLGNYGMSGFSLDQYIERHFGSYVQEVGKDWKQPLDYGWEYIAAGKASDSDNLKAVLNRILLIRTVVNFLALQRDSVKKEEAYAAAVAIVGFTGLAPLITLTQTLILLTWSLSESFVDVAAILQKRHVPLMKGPSELVTGFAEIVQMGQKAVTKRALRFRKERKTSFGYKQYLLLFLALTKQSVRRYRVMDLIQNGMQKNGYRGFQLGSCVYEMKVQGEFTFPSRFFRMAPLEALLGRDIQSCQIVCEMWAGYSH